MSSKYNIKYQSGGGTINDLNGGLQFFFKHQMEIKMLHFTTDKYNHHKIFDEYLSKFSSNFDKLIEVGQGVFGKLTFGELEIKISKINDPMAYCTFTLSEMDNLGKKFEGTPLVNIIDDMKADVLQMKYLLNFQ
jgi:hypothetical protein